MILVTGASGKLGKEISRQLSQGKRDFRCLVRKSSKVKELEEMGANLSYGDVTDRESLRQAMQGVDAGYLNSLCGHGKERDHLLGCRLSGKP